MNIFCCLHKIFFAVPLDPLSPQPPSNHGDAVYVSSEGLRALLRLAIACLGTQISVSGSRAASGRSPLLRLVFSVSP
jgi:hypothetical protein